MYLTQVLTHFHHPKLGFKGPYQSLKNSEKFLRTSWNPYRGGCRPSSMGRATILSTSQRSCKYNGPFSGPKPLNKERIYPKYMYMRGHFIWPAL
jgi:hypothetical protein